MFSLIIFLSTILKTILKRNGTRNIKTPYIKRFKNVCEEVLETFSSPDATAFTISIVPSTRSNKGTLYWISLITILIIFKKGCKLQHVCIVSLINISSLSKNSKIKPFGFILLVSSKQRSYHKFLYLLEQNHH